MTLDYPEWKRDRRWKRVKRFMLITVFVMWVALNVIVGAAFIRHGQDFCS